MLNADFTFINYIKEETKSYANKVILFSTIIILISLKIISIREIEFEGFKIETKEYMLIVIILIVNIYFYLQFLNSIKIDSLVANIPNEISSITDEVLKKLDEETEKLNLINEKHQKLLISGNLNEKNKEDLLNETSKINNGETSKLLKNWYQTYTKLVKRHKNNEKLYVFFPSFCFWVATIIFILRIYTFIETTYFL
jgi:hypothetical protein